MSPSVWSLQVEENLGMVMIFTLVTAVQEKLNEIVDLMKNRIEEEKRRKEKEAEEAEKVGKRKGQTRSTVITADVSCRWRSRARWSPSRTSWHGKQHLTWKWLSWGKKNRRRMSRAARPNWQVPESLREESRFPFPPLFQDCLVRLFSYWRWWRKVNVRNRKGRF